MCHCPVLKHEGGSAVHLVLRIQGYADWAWRGCVAPRQAESEVLVGSKEGAKIVVGELRNFLADGGKDADDIKKQWERRFVRMGGMTGGTSFLTTWALLRRGRA